MTRKGYPGGFKEHHLWISCNRWGSKKIKMTENANYNLSNIRTLLVKGFLIEDILRFCFSSPTFRPAYEQLSSGDGLSTVVDKVIRYAVLKVLVDELLDWAKRENPARYDLHAPYYQYPMGGIRAVQDHLRYYKQSLANSLRTYLVNPGIEFKLTYRTAEGPSEVSVEELLDRVLEKKRIIMHGPSGGGKTLLLKRLTLQALEKDIVPIFLNLRNWKSTYYQELCSLSPAHQEIGEKFDVLLRVSLGDLSWSKLREFPELPHLILVDGLNEVYGPEVVRHILDLLSEYVRLHLPGAHVLVADRTARRIQSPWLEIEINSLSDSEVIRVMCAHSGIDSYTKLRDNEKLLLQIPYFLDYWLTGHSFQLDSAANAIHSFFTKQMNLAEEQLDLMAQSAFNAYKEEQSLYFAMDGFCQAVGDTIFERLLESGTLQRLTDGSLQYDHQLKHDYLASRYLASNESHWTVSSFDAVTFKSSSFETLTMALDQITSIPNADRFIESVYDWNWVATATCMKNASRSDTRRYSKEIELFVTATVAAKLFDPIQGTAQRAREALSTLPAHLVDSLLCSNSIEDIIYLVKKVRSEKEWFLKWKEMFTKDVDFVFTEREINLITSKDSKLGWTVANVLRRFKLEEPELRQIRAIHDSFDEADYRDGTVRWRIVHVLGGFDTKENVEVLLNALDRDPYFWTRYGATRALIEIAARTEHKTLRDIVILELKKRAGLLPPMIQDEIGRAVFYRGASGAWEIDGTALLETVKEVQDKDCDREKWTQTIKQFEDFYVEKN